MVWITCYGRARRRTLNIMTLLRGTAVLSKIHTVQKGSQCAAVNAWSRCIHLGTSVRSIGSCHVSSLVRTVFFLSIALDQTNSRSLELIYRFILYWWGITILTLFVRVIYRGHSFIWSKNMIGGYFTHLHIIFPFSLFFFFSFLLFLIGGKIVSTTRRVQPTSCF